MEAFERFLADLSATGAARSPICRSRRTAAREIQEYADMERHDRRGRRPRSTAPTARPPGRRSATSTAPTAARRWPASIAAARAALVTPLRDGMNLVAKEYVAAQDPEDPGVLILSRFAGAAVECKAALLVNPYDPEAVATAIAQALSMPLEERRARHATLFQVISENDLKLVGRAFSCGADQGRSPDAVARTARPRAAAVHRPGVMHIRLRPAQKPRSRTTLPARHRRRSTGPPSRGGHAAPRASRNASG